MIKEVTIRFAQKEDVNRLVKLCEQHAEFEKASYETKGKEQKLSASLFNESPPVYCLVALVNHKIIGYASYMKQFSTWDAYFYIYMDCLFVTNESRGLGIGQKLIERVKEEARNAGCNLVQWQTPDFNKRAMRFYNRIGAKSISKERYFLEV